MTAGPSGASAEPFRYGHYDLDPESGRLTCHYSLGQHRFAEEIRIRPPDDMAHGGRRAPTAVLEAAARLVHLFAGVSYYKTSAPNLVDLGDIALTGAERAFLRTFFVEGLGEFAYRNQLDLSGLEFVGPEVDHRPPISWTPDRRRPLVPFGGGIDSIVTVESVRNKHPDLALFVMNRPGDRFDAIEQALTVTGLPVVRAERRIDPDLLRSATLGFLRGHVPITGILSAVAVLAAAFTGHGTVVMSNEWSSSSGNLVVDGHEVNHQWSKSMAFEAAWRAILDQTFSPGADYFSFLRSRSELWVGKRFADLGSYHGTFRSCNRAFAQDPSRRLAHWCGICDKCCFVDLVLSPYMSPAELAAVFDGAEPLANQALADQFRVLVGTGSGPKPFDCVGDVHECRAALASAARRPDRATAPMLQLLAAELADSEIPAVHADQLLLPLGPDFVPDHYLPEGVPT